MISRPCHQHYFYIWLSQPQPIFLSQPQNEQKVSRNSKYSQNILGLSLKETADCQNNCFIQIFSFLNPEHLIFFCEIGFLNMLLFWRQETRESFSFILSPPPKLSPVSQWRVSGADPSQLEGFLSFLKSSSSPKLWSNQAWRGRCRRQCWGTIVRSVRCIIHQHQAHD